MASGIARTLGIQEKASQVLLDSLKESLQDKQMLLVLDNFEQVVAAAPLVAELLATCPRLKCLMTSRVMLRLSGEHEFLVPPLELPDPRRLPAVDTLSQYAAVELFIQRSLAVKPDFRVDNDNAPAVAEICVRLDGLPLAIELAAARIKLFPPQAILARLGRRLELLHGGARGMPDRHQTLRQAIAWSYDLLEAGEQVLFRRLAVFARGCTLEAVEAVYQAVPDPVAGPGQSLEVLDGVASLVDKSLLRQQEQASGEPRFRMLETIREYALECLTASGEEAAVRRAHADYYLALAEVAEPALTLQRHFPLTPERPLGTLLLHSPKSSRRPQMLPACRTEDDGFAIPTFDVIRSDVEGCMDELWEVQSAFHDCFSRSEPRAQCFDYMVGQLQPA